jgi:two-component system chemotaxis response regulator CheY
VLDISGFAVGDCAEASNGEEALELLHRQWIDVILTDINMPRMDGEEFLRRLEQDELLRSIPALVVSTDRTETRVRKMLGMGARGYVKKPFAAETLRDELERVLGVADARA